MCASVRACLFLAVLALASLTSCAPGQAFIPPKDEEGNIVDYGAGSDGNTIEGGYALLNEPATYVLAAASAVGGIVARRSWLRAHPLVYPWTKDKYTQLALLTNEQLALHQEVGDWETQLLRTSTPLWMAHRMNARKKELHFRDDLLKNYKNRILATCFLKHVPKLMPQRAEALKTKLQAVEAQAKEAGEAPPRRRHRDESSTQISRSYAEQLMPPGVFKQQLARRVKLPSSFHSGSAIPASGAGNRRAPALVGGFGRAVGGWR